MRQDEINAGNYNKEKEKMKRIKKHVPGLNPIKKKSLLLIKDFTSDQSIYCLDIEDMADYINFKKRLYLN